MEKSVKYDVNTVLEIYEMKQFLYSQREKTAKELKAFSVAFQKKRNDFQELSHYLYEELKIDECLFKVFNKRKCTYKQTTGYMVCYYCHLEIEKEKSGSRT